MSRFQSYAPLHLDRLDADPVLLERVTPDKWGTLLDGPKGAHEYHLQELLATAPGVLPFEEFSSVFAPSVCIGREVSTSKGAIDNLFMSTQGRLTIVETKLFKNSGARREVVAQAIDYLLDVGNWNYLRLNRIAAEYLESRSPGSRHPSLAEFVLRQPSVKQEENPPQEEGLEDRFKAQVDRSLSSGEVLVLIVGDHIDPRAIELLDFARTARAEHLRLRSFEMGLVELAFYQHPVSKYLTVVPHTLAKAVVAERTVVDVRVNTQGSVEVNVKPSEVDERGTSERRPRIASEEQYYEYVRENAPAAEPGRLFKVALSEATIEAVLVYIEAVVRKIGPMLAKA